MPGREILPGTTKWADVRAMINRMTQELFSKKEYLCAVATVAQTMTTGTFQSVNFDRVDAQVGDYLSITVGNLTYNGTAYVSTSGAEINLKEGRTYELMAGVACTFAGLGTLVLQFQDQDQTLGSEMQIVAVNGGSNIAHNPTAIAIVPPVAGRNRAVRLVAKTIPTNGVTLTAARCWLRVREI